MSTISKLNGPGCIAWDSYVKNMAHGLPQHLSGWRKVLYKTYGYETPYLMACEGERVVGVLPLFFVRSVLTGSTATTMPGGLCADSEEVAAELIACGREIAQQAKAKRFVLHDTRQTWSGDLHTTSSHIHWIVDVGTDAETLWKRLDGNIRRQVRIARRNELTVEIDRTGHLLGAFYEVFSRYTHQLGTPVFGRDFLENILDTFPNGFNIAVVHKEQQPIGAYFQLQMGDTVYGTWGATLREYLKLRPVYLAYWAILEDAISNEYDYLDMGRSPVGSNASKYKGQWGGVSQPIYQQVATMDNVNGHDSIANQIHSDDKFQWAIRLWPKLPLPVTRYLGPKLRHHVPFA